jgi:hypothetical protein
MTSELAAGLRALQVYAETLPPGTAVPVPRETLLELLAGRAGGVAAHGGPPADLTVADLCTWFRRKPSAVRAWLERGDFPEAYKLKGRDWRVPAAAVEAFRANQARDVGERAPAEGDLGAWRRLRARV